MSFPNQRYSESRSENGGLDFYQLDPALGLGTMVGKVDSNETSRWALSPDGFRIAVTNKTALLNHVLILNTIDSTQRTLSLSPPWDLREIAWTDDGTFLLGIGLRQGNSFIVKIALDGKTQIVLDRGKDTVISSPRPSPDGRHLYFTQTMWESNAWLLENF